MARRAAKEAAKDTKLDTLASATIALISQSLICVFLFIIVGQLQGATIWTRVLTAAAPLLTFPFAFLVRMITVPAALHNEFSSALDKAKSAQSQRLGTLRGYYARGQVIANMAVPDDEAFANFKSMFSDWANETINWIHENISDGAAAKFNDRSNHFASIRIGANYKNHEYDNILSLLNALLRNLNEIILSSNWHGDL